jgi:hypothetical protein
LISSKTGEVFHHHATRNITVGMPTHTISHDNKQKLILGQKGFHGFDAAVADVRIGGKSRHNVVVLVALAYFASVSFGCEIDVHWTPSVQFRGSTPCLWQPRIEIPLFFGCKSTKNMAADGSLLDCSHRLAEANAVSMLANLLRRTTM